MKDSPDTTCSPGGDEEGSLSRSAGRGGVGVLEVRDASIALEAYHQLLFQPVLPTLGSQSCGRHKIKICSMAGKVSLLSTTL